MFNSARQALETLYTGKCTITEYQKTTDPDTKKTSFKEIDVATDIPGRLSFSTVSAATAGSGSVAVAQTVKWFMAPDITVKPNSRLTVTQNGITTTYKSSGVPAVHETHQEIELTLFERWA